MKYAIHAIHPHVVHILNVETLTVYRVAHVQPPTLVHLQIVAQSVRSAQSVPAIRLAYVRSVQIHVLDHVAFLPDALFLIIHQFVHALKDMLVIHSLAVGQLLPYVSIYISI